MVLAVIGGALQIPGVDDALTKFLEPTFATSRLYNLEAGTGTEWVGLIIGALIAVAGISIAYRIWVLKPGTSAALRGAPAPAAHLPLQQVVLRRAHRHAHRAARTVAGPLQ